MRLKRIDKVIDLELLNLIGLDPEEGFRVVHARYGAHLLGRLEAHCRNREYGDGDVADIFQEALMRLIDPEKRDQCIASGGLILPWLTKWGYWRLDDLSRARVTWRSRVAHSVIAEGPSGMAATAAAQLVSEALVLLTPRDQRLLQLRYGECLTEPEIALAMKLTLGATKKALHDARSRLKKVLYDLGLPIEAEES